MHTPEQDGYEPSSERKVSPLKPDFMSAYEDIIQEIAKPHQEQDRNRAGYWRRADENSVRNYSVSGEGYCDIGPRVSCTIVRCEEGLDIAVRPPDIFDNRCQLFFVRQRIPNSNDSGFFVVRTPVMPSHPTDNADIPLMDALDERQVQALYAAITTPSVERLG